MKRIRGRQAAGLVIAFVAGALVWLGGMRLLYERNVPIVPHDGPTYAGPTSSSPKLDPPKRDRPAPEPPKPAPERRKPAVGLDDADILLYVEALAHIRDKAIRLKPDVTRAQIVEQSLRAYLGGKEPCCDYLSREDYRRFKESLNDRYVGIGMEIKQDREGRTICLPDPESPAARAGIARGNELRAIDGVRIEGKSIFNVATLARGKPGSEVRVAVATADGREREFKIVRSTVSLRSVSVRTVEGNPIIVLSRFTRETEPALADALKGWPRDVPIIIDLRGNGGGDLHAAIGSARLLLDKGKRVASVETRTGTRTYDSVAGAVNRTSPVYLWQDEGTASAAEVFIAALIDNGRAVSIGRGTTGKGTVDEIIGLSDGSALILATGHLLTPKGVRYQGRGLKPIFEMTEGASDTPSYLMKVREVS